MNGYGVKLGSMAATPFVYRATHSSSRAREKKERREDVLAEG